MIRHTLFLWDPNYVKALALNYHLQALLKHIGAFYLALFKKKYFA